MATPPVACVVYTAMLRIDLAPLAEGVHHFDLQTEAETLELDPDTFTDIRIDVVLDFHNERAMMSLHAMATATLECDRTLVTFEQPIEGTYRLLAAPASFVRRADSDDDEFEEVRVLEPSEHTVDLTDVVRDTLLLAVPARKVAPGAEDIDIQTVFGEADPSGEEPSIDPRWEALRALRTDSESDGS